MVIAVRSKDRVNTKQHILFPKYDCYYFLEPQDYDRYKVPNKINIGKNDQGLSYANNFILNWAKQNNHEWVLICDDDITHFGYVKDKKCIKSDASIWEQVLAKSKKLPFSVIGINNRQYAWSSAKNYSINKAPVGGTVLLNMLKINWKYDKGMKQDRDFCMNAIKYSAGVLKFNKLFYNTGTVGNQKGGSHEFYKQGKDVEAVKYLSKKWQPYTEVKKINGRIDLKFKMKEYAESLNKPVK